MASIKLKHSGGNGVIIAAPTSNPASDKTLTLPSDVDGTVVSKDSSNSLQNIAGINGGQLGNRNLIINGAMQVAQRGTSSTSNGYHTIDRFNFSYGGTDESPTMAQVDVASGTTPYTLGFRKALKITNGNQTSGAGAADFLEFYQYVEDQDISNSGWNFKSASSFLTISFWVKSSVSQKFTGFFYTNQAGAGDSYMYSYQIDNGSGGNLTADTWTKVTHSIPGNSNLTLNNDNTRGLAIGFYLFEGTDYSTSNHTENTWAAWNSSNKIKDMTSTWYTTNDATFEITGVQLEVGSVATVFEHRSYADELRKCERYYEITATGQVFKIHSTGGYVEIPLIFRTQKRANPTMTLLSSEENFVTSVSVVGGNSTEKIYQAGLRGNDIDGSGDGNYLYGKASAEAEL